MTMYATCLNCDRSLGSNADLEHLPVGRRVAFDEETGRVWVICLRCRQWNLVPIEIRWEALEECTRVAASAESRVKGTGVGFARTASGFELLTATEFSRADIANWRYGRAVRRRMRGLWLTAGAMGLAVTAIGVNAGVAGGSWFVGAWITACAALWTWHAWRNPSRLWVTVRVAGAGPSLLPGWRLEALRFVRRSARRVDSVVLILPTWRGDVELTGSAAARALHSLLPALNDTDCIGASIAEAVGIVTRGEQQRKVRPWEWIAMRLHDAPLLRATPVERLALEMAVVEELEQHALTIRAQDAQTEWGAEEEIGGIADDLLLPDAVRERMRRLAEGEAGTFPPT